MYTYMYTIYKALNVFFSIETFLSVLSTAYLSKPRVLSPHCSVWNEVDLEPMAFIHSSSRAGLKNNTHPLVFTSASVCRASEIFDIFSEN